MKQRRIISIIIPTLNEENTIRQVLSSIPHNILEPVEVLVVDGGSVDGTVEVARSLGATVVEQTKPGYSNAILEGISLAKGDVLVFIDGDGVYDPREIPSLLSIMESQDADLVIGSRFLGEIKPGNIPWLKYLVNRLFNYLLRIFLGRKISDPGSGFIVAKKASLLRLKEHLQEPIKYSMIVVGLNKGLKIIEAPITFYPRIGKSKLCSMREFLWSFHGMLKTKIRRV